MHLRLAPSCLYATLLLVPAFIATAQEPPVGAVATPAEPQLTVDRIEQFRQEAEGAVDIDEETKKRTAEKYRLAIADAQLTAELKSRTESLNADTAAVAQRVEETRRQLEQLKSDPQPPASGLSLGELEQAYTKLELTLAAQKKVQGALATEAQSRSQRRKDIRAQLATVQETLAKLPPQIDEPAPEENPHFTLSKRVKLATRRQSLELQGPALESELAKYDAEDAVDLVRLKHDLITREVALTERRMQLVKEQIKSARAVAAEESVKKARDEAIAAIPSLKSYAERNHQLAELSQATAQRLDAAEKDLKAAQEVYEQLQKQYESTQKKITVGLTSSVGALLRKQRTTLPDIASRQSQVALRQAQIDETQYRIFEFDEERQELADPEQFLQKILDEARAAGGHDSDALKVAAEELLNHKRDYLDALLRNSNKYWEALVELGFADKQIIDLTKHYQQFIDERVLWIRSGKLLSADFRVGASDAWMLNPRRWGRVASAMLGDLQRRPALYGLAGLIFAALLVQRRRLRRELKSLGEVAHKANCRTLAPTLRALFLTGAIALLWPGLCGFLAWRLGVAGTGAPFAVAFAAGLWSMCLLWFPLEAFRQLCRAGGVAEAHFAWPVSATRTTRRELRWFMWLALPLLGTIATVNASDSPHGRDSVERSLFILGTLVLATFLYRLLRPAKGALREHIASNQGTLIERAKYLWVGLGVATPLTLAGLAFSGHYYTAQVLSWRLYLTCCFILSMLVLRDLMLRLLLLRRRNLSIEQARQRAAAAMASGQDAGSPVAGIVTAEPQSDLTEQSLQTRRLLTSGLSACSLVGLWLIWVQVLPALSMLDKYVVWPASASTTMADAGAAAAPTPMPPGSPSSTSTPISFDHSDESAAGDVTLSDLALAILIVVVMFVMFRNGPGLLEIALLQRLPFDASVRYAITTLVSYAIVLVGTIAACSTIGLQWSQIQWLATALTFGLAFGLQEIFANFVAGLIILLERPIRVGDIVTIDDVTGVVSRIRIRATAITNWDRKEYVVPNKEFITGRLLNWTLSDKINRIVIEVGVAYGSDTELAKQLLLKAANEHPMILKDPPSLASFEGFGDNSLNMVLRTYLPTMDGRLDVIHQLHTAIDKSFREAGIEIAFPQLDLHVKSNTVALSAGANEEAKRSTRRGEAA